MSLPACATVSPYERKKMKTLTSIYIKNGFLCLTHADLPGSHIGVRRSEAKVWLEGDIVRIKSEAIDSSFKRGKVSLEDLQKVLD